MTSRLSGVQLSLLTAVISGVSIFINKFAVGVVKPPVLFTGVKNTLVGIVLLCLLVGLGKLKQFRKLNKYQWMQLVAVGIIGGYLPFYLFFNGLAIAGAVNGALIHKTLVFWVAILALPILKEKLSLLQLAGIMLLFYANVFTGGFLGFKFNSGELMVLGATILWSVENIIAKKALTNMDPDILTFGRMGIGSTLLLITANFASPGSLGGLLSLSVTGWFWLMATSISLLLYVVTWYRALKVEKVTVISSILVSSTVITSLLNAIFVTHNWNAIGSLQIVLTALGVLMFIRGSKGFDYKLASN